MIFNVGVQMSETQKRFQAVAMRSLRFFPYDVNVKEDQLQAK